MSGRAIGWWFGLALLTGLPAALASCTTDSYCFANCGEVAGSGGQAGTASGGSAGSISGGSAGTISFSGQAGQSGAAGTAGTSGSAGCVANLQTDPSNCGSCGTKCALPGAFPACTKGKCTVGQCAPGRYDLNGKPEDGCEYACVPTADPTEICDAVDNNCNGQIDEGSDLQTDDKNCGACGVSCASDLPHASATACVKGLCAVTTCADGYGDANKVPGDGCEYQCPVNPPVAETCDGVDNDCDGNVDNGNPGGGQPCTDTCPNGVCQGQCTAGTRQCAGNGNYLCLAGIGPSIETCDTVDNDCDGVVDNGFDLQKDTNNCGACGKKCDFKNAAVACVDGDCSFVACQPGFSDVNNDPTDGCEYGCPTDVPGVEVCDGIDNDCNGVVDDNLIVPPAGFCNSKAGTPCEGTTPQCQGVKGFVCPYGADAEVNEDGTLKGIETRCDGKDGNCDGQIDETFPLVAKPCDDGGVGLCRGTGTYACTADQTSVECAITKPGQSGPQAETCDGKDNDCNGQIDDNLPDSAFALVASGVGSVMVDAFEASRPDATSSSAGLLANVACSRQNVKPWVSVAHAQAAAACSARGPKYRLCSAAELSQSCANNAAKNTFPYGNTYQPASCNGEDFAPTGAIAPTGSLNKCVNTAGAYDLSGNASEWTSTKTGETKTNPNYSIYQLQGGSFLSPEPGLECAIDLAPRAAENAIFDSVGFRCCKDP